MILKKIELYKKLKNNPPKLATSKLYIKEIYGEKKDKWECYEKTKEKKVCPNELSNLIINIPKEKISTFGIKSKEKIIYLDKRRFDIATFKIRFNFTPKKTNSFIIALGNENITLKKNSLNQYTIKWGKRGIERVVPTKWLEEIWNGKVDITINRDWVRVQLIGGTLITIDKKIIDRFDIKVLALPLGEKAKNDLYLELKKITTEWLVPKNMNKLDYLELTSDKNFNIDNFFEEILEDDGFDPNIFSKEIMEVE